MYLGIQPDDGNYDIHPGQLSEKTDKTDHAHLIVNNEVTNTDLDSITNFIIRDLENTGKSVRIISSYKDAQSDETVVALKNRDSFINLDYHCAILLDDGTWADKQGTGHDSRQGFIKNPDGVWGEWWKSYNSKTIYLAISEP